MTTGNNWRQVSSGGTFVASIKTDGTLWTWGCNFSGALGNASTVSSSSPVQTVATGNNWKQVSTSSGGGGGGAAVKTDGTLWIWGLNQRGQLGIGTTINRSSPGQVIGAATTWKQVALGYSSAAGVKTDGTLWTWGDNTLGALGIGCVCVLGPGPTNNWQQISSTCGVKAGIKCDGTLWMWGCGVNGGLGNGTTINQSSPVQTVGAATTWCQISVSIFGAAGNSSVGLKTDGTLWSMGNNNCGQLGGGTTQAGACSPIQILGGGTTWKQAASGSLLQGGVKTDGTLWMWGFNGLGNLGNGTTITQSSPVQTIAAGTTWCQVSIGTCNTVVAVKTDGTLWVWGNNINGSLGGGTTLAAVSSPIQVLGGGTTWKQAAIGVAGGIGAIKTDGTLWTWGGSNLTGQLGDGTTFNRSSPVQIFGGGTTWKQVAASSNSLQATKTDGTLWTWGYNNCGQLGNGQATPSCGMSSPVQTTAGGTTWNQVATTIAVKTDGTLWTWGDATAGQLGDATNTGKSSVVQVVGGGTTWKCVSVGACNMAAIKTDGTLWVWGANTKGGLGTNNLVCYSSPVQTVAGGNNWKQVSITRDLLGAIKTDGTLWTIGCGACGVLGRGGNENMCSPVQTIGSGTNWKQVSAGSAGSYGNMGGVTFC